MHVLFDKYRVLEQLHQTECNTIYLAEHTTIHTKRIIKRMKKANNFQLPEVEILRKLSHPNIPKIIDMEEDSEAVYLIREYAEGKDLEQWLEEKGKFQETELVQIARQLASALRYLHEGLEMPIIYRDLKPENIILNEEGYLFLIDFGIARYASPERTKDTYFLGTRAYAAPEQFGVFRSDEKSDVYAFGMTLYYLLGRHKITEAPYKRREMESWLTEYSEDFIHLVYACSHPQREKRPESFSEILNRLSEADESMKKPSIPEKAWIYMGIRRGAGTSFVTYSHALCEAAGGKRVAVLDWSESGQMEKLSYIMDATEMKKYSFAVDGIEIFPQSKKQESRIDWKEYDRVLIDYGVLNSEKRKQMEEYRENIRLVCSGAPWDVTESANMK